MIDALMLVGENRFGPSIGWREALALGDDLGIDAIVAAPARPRDYHLGPANTALASAAAQSHGRLIALGRVDPTDGAQAVDEARRCLETLGCAGLYLHPGEESFPVRIAGPILDVAAERGVPVTIAAGLLARSEPLQVAELAAAWPSVPVIMTNGGRLDISGLTMMDVWQALTSTPNLHVLTNGEYRQDQIERLARELDPARLLYASFAPEFDARFEVARIRSAHLAGDARRAIEHDNAGRLFRR